MIKDFLFGKRYIRNTELLRAISRVAVPALFVYGGRDILSRG
jgi:hypothetical protein